MPLKFNCPHCSTEIVAKFLRVGESCLCRSCNQSCQVPDGATEVDESESDIPTSQHAFRINSSNSTLVGKVAEADPSRRVFARILDSVTYGVGTGFVFGAGTMALTLSQAEVLEEIPAEVQDVFAIQMPIMIMIMAGFGLLMLGTQAYFITNHGQSLCKKVFSLRVVDYTTGQIPGFYRAIFLREVVCSPLPFLLLSMVPQMRFLVGLLFVCYLIANISCVVSGEGRGLHDFLAGTKVESFEGDNLPEDYIMKEPPTAAGPPDGSAD